MGKKPYIGFPHHQLLTKYIGHLKAVLHYMFKSIFNQKDYVSVKLIYNDQ